MFQRLREDFCGTAALACRWVSLGEDNQAWGVDLDRDTLDWGLEQHVARLDQAAQRMKMICADVRSVSRPQVDVVLALNFSFCVFKERNELLKYFRKVRRSLRPGGVFIMDIFGGTGAREELIETQRKPAFRSPNGRRIPAFTYVWEQVRYNPINHHIYCHIHFKFRGGRTMKRAFTYDWRLWTLPELREILEEAGFLSSDIYAEGWDEEDDESDGIFRKRKQFSNQDSWVAYVVGLA
jgi:SAM-dependent methyltransferase